MSRSNPNSQIGTYQLPEGGVTLSDPEFYVPLYREPIIFAQSVIQMRVADVQRRIMNAVRDNRYTLIVSGNGVGKTYTVIALILWYLCTRVNSMGLMTSRDFRSMKDTAYRSMKSMFSDLKERYKPAVGGTAYKQPLINMPGDDWYFRAISPSNPGGLEGRHNEGCIVVIEEADKPEITEDHFESAETSMTSTSDRMVAVANPPESENNVVSKMMEPESKWHVVQFSSFDSHNVQVDLGNIDGPKIGGLIELDLIKERYEDWNNQAWPGLNQAMQNPRTPRESLNEKWYRRTLGVIPPDTADVSRPIKTGDVKPALYQSPPSGMPITAVPQGIALDVARGGGDRNAFGGRFGGELQVFGVWSGQDHNVGEEKVRTLLSRYQGDKRSGGEWNAPFAVDTSPIGSGLSDRISLFYPNRVEFKNNYVATESQKYDRYWEEGLAVLGNFFAAGGTIKDDPAGYGEDLYDEILTAARVTTWEETWIGKRKTSVNRATAKSDIENELGYSPDLLDMAIMAVWASEYGSQYSQSVRSTWGY